MCVANGAPAHPTKQTERQKGMQELWDFLRGHDAVYVGCATLTLDLEAYLTKNKVIRGPVTPKQEAYTSALKVLAGG